MKQISNLLLHRRLQKDLAAQRPRLYRIAYSWCHNQALADDLVQETLYKAMKKIGGLREYSTLEAWLYRIMLNNWHDHLRVSGRDVELYDMDDERQTPQVDSYQQGQIIDRVRSSVADLPTPLREVVTLADFAGFTYAEIAEIVDIPIGTVMSRLYRARQTLKDNLLDLAGDQALPVRLRRVK